MNPRLVLGAFALAGVCLIGCGDDKKKDGEKKDNGKDKTEKKDSAAKNAPKENEGPSKKPEPELPENYVPYVAENWRPDPGQADPSAWKPQDSKATKAGSAIFGAITRAVTSGGDNVSKDQVEPEKQP